MSPPTLSFEDAEQALITADAAGDAVPDAIIDVLLYYFEDWYGLSPVVNAALHRLPAARFAQVRDAIHALLLRREANLADSTQPAFAEYVADPEFDQAFVTGIVRNAQWALDKKDFFSTYQTLSSSCEMALGGGVYTCMLLDRVLAELATIKSFATSGVGAELRLFFRRVRFMALRGTARPLELVMPGDDLVWVDSIGDAIGYQNDKVGLSDDESERLFAAWSAVDWDATLGVGDRFEREVAPPHIEDRPWDELAALVLQTSLHRLARGQRDRETITRVFARPEPLDARVALAESLAAFALAQGARGKDALTIIIGAIVPHLAAAGREPTGVLAKAIAKLAKKPPAKRASRQAAASR